jgi:hypothetical protein
VNFAISTGDSPSGFTAVGRGIENEHNMSPLETALGYRWSAIASSEARTVS